MNCIGFEPVADINARVLILGTLPGTKSLELHQYYAKPSNHLWRIMEELLGALPSDYDDRLRALVSAGIALWDVCLSAERAGSLDAKIIMSTVVPNDFATFLRAHPGIGLICFNGRTAERIFQRKVSAAIAGIASIRCALLPSSSAAHAITQEQKVSHWHRVLSGAIQHN